MPVSDPVDDPLPRLREICLRLPKVTERLSHGEPTWFVGRTFVTYADHHHDAGSRSGARRRSGARTS